MVSSEPTTVQEIVRALRELGGTAHVREIKDRVADNRGGIPPQYEGRRSYRMTIQKIIQRYCPQSSKSQHQHYFERVERGHYRLIRVDLAEAADTIPGVAAPQPPRPSLTAGADDEAAIAVYRQRKLRLRKAALAVQVKELYGFRCQLCGEFVTLSGGLKYAEAHHMQPLGGEHGGPDQIENMLCVCPNHHVQLDYGAIPLDLNGLNILPSHGDIRKFVRYHNEKVYSTAIYKAA